MKYIQAARVLNKVESISRARPVVPYLQYWVQGLMVRGQGQGLEVQGQRQGQVLVKWYSRILEDKDFPRGLQRCIPAVGRCHAELTQRWLYAACGTRQTARALVELVDVRRSPE